MHLKVFVSGITVIDDSENDNKDAREDLVKLSVFVIDGEQKREEEDSKILTLTDLEPNEKDVI